MRPRPSGPAAPGFVRILGGAWKRSRLMLPRGVGDELRPTPIRLRQVIFDWLGDLSGAACLDAFAGTGALGIEAASRGAQSVLFLERSAAQLAMLRANLARLAGEAAAYTVQAADAFAWLAQQARAVAPLHWDIVFLDPPFALERARRVELLRLAAGVVAVNGRVIFEADEDWSAEDFAPCGLALQRSSRAGRARGFLLKTVPGAPGA